MKTVCYAVLFYLVLVSPAGVFAQATGDYRSNGTGGGNWNSAATWQTYSGTGWVPAAAPPSGSEFITIQSPDSVGVNVAVAITGTLRNQSVLGGAANLTIAGTGTLQHDRDAGSLPLATWSTGSTVLITGSTGTTPNNRNQSFYNVVFNTPGLLSNLNMGWDSVTIGGNITVTNTASSRWQMTAPAAGDSSIFSLMGDIIVTGGNFTSNGSSNANTRIVIHQYGDIIVTGGNLSVSRGSQGSGTGSTRWYLHDGNFSMTNGTTQNSNAANAWFVFDKPGTQFLTLGSGNTLTALPIVVSSGTTLDMGVSELAGSGRFILDPGSGLATAHAGGIAGAVGAVTGTVTLATDANYAFNGTVAQVTSASMPVTVHNLAINNAAGVTLSQATTINGVLRLQAGVFNNTIPFTLGPGGSISYEGGSLLIPLSVGSDPSIPQVFFVEQNYPNPFNPVTTLRFGLPGKVHVTARVFDMLGREVVTLFDGTKEAGVHALEFDGSGIGSGVYLCRIHTGTSVGVTRMVLVK